MFDLFKDFMTLSWSFFCHVMYLDILCSTLNLKRMLILVVDRS